MTRQQLALFPLDDPKTPDGSLERAAHDTIDALRAQSAIQPWHELDCQIVLDLARAVAESRGIAKSQMFGALLQARSRLPEPVITETDDELIVYESEREIEWARRHEPGAIASNVPDGAHAG